MAFAAGEIIDAIRSAAAGVAGERRGRAGLVVQLVGHVWGRRDAGGTADVCQ